MGLRELGGCVSKRATLGPVVPGPLWVGLQIHDVGGPLSTEPSLVHPKGGGTVRQEKL